MRLIVLATKIVCLATDDYKAVAKETVVDAPPDFDVTRVADYRYADGVWSFAAPPPAPPPALTPLDFLRRFTLAERIAVRDAVDPAINDFLHLLGAAGEVRPDHPDAMAGVGYLVQQRLLTAGRAAAILAPAAVSAVAENPGDRPAAGRSDGV